MISVVFYKKNIVVILTYLIDLLFVGVLFYIHIIVIHKNSQSITLLQWLANYI